MTALASEAAIYHALTVRYAPPAWAIFRGVRDAAGFDARRTSDAIAMALWPSRGLEIHGFEIKVSRSDWLRELKDPSKAEAAARHCDRWWLAVTDADLVKPGELPPTWGLLAPRGGRLVAKVEASKLPSPSLDRSFVAALLRRAHEAATLPGEAALKAARDEGWSAAMAKQAARNEQSDSHAARVATDNAEAIAAFERGAGRRLARWQAEEIGKEWRDACEFASTPRAVADMMRMARDSAQRAYVVLDQRLDAVERFDAAARQKAVADPQLALEP